MSNYTVIRKGVLTVSANLTAKEKNDRLYSKIDFINSEIIDDSSLDDSCFGEYEFEVGCIDSEISIEEAKGIVEKDGWLPAKKEHMVEYILKALEIEKEIIVAGGGNLLDGIHLPGGREKFLPCLNIVALGSTYSEDSGYTNLLPILLSSVNCYINEEWCCINNLTYDHWGLRGRNRGGVREYFILRVRKVEKNR